MTLTFHAVEGEPLAELGRDDEEDGLGVGVLDLARLSILLTFGLFGLFVLFLILVWKIKKLSCYISFGVFTFKIRKIKQKKFQQNC